MGMNRVAEADTPATTSVPHTHGDEPAKAQMEIAAALRSPHAWG